MGQEFRSMIEIYICELPTLGLNLETHGDHLGNKCQQRRVPMIELWGILTLRGETSNVVRWINLILSAFIDDLP